MRVPDYSKCRKREGRGLKIHHFAECPFQITPNQCPNTIFASSVSGEGASKPGGQGQLPSFNFITKIIFVYFCSHFMQKNAEADPEGGEGGSSPGKIFRLKDVNFLDSFLQVFCWLQFTGRCSLITNHNAFRANIQRYTCSKLYWLRSPDTYHYQIKLLYLYSQNKRYSEPPSSAKYRVIY